MFSLPSFSKSNGHAGETWFEIAERWVTPSIIEYIAKHCNVDKTVCQPLFFQASVAQETEDECNDAGTAPDVNDANDDNNDANDDVNDDGNCGAITNTVNSCSLN